MNAASRPKAAHKKSVRPKTDARAPSTARDMLAAGREVEGRVEITATYAKEIPPDALPALWALAAGGALHVEGRRVQIVGRTSDGDHDTRLIVDQLIDALPHDMTSIGVQWSAFHAPIDGVPMSADDDDIPF